MDMPPSVMLAAGGSCRPAAETAEVRSILHCNAITDRFKCVAARAAFAKIVPMPLPSLTPFRPVNSCIQILSSL
jgi:hypothetical protein